MATSLATSAHCERTLLATCFIIKWLIALRAHAPIFSHNSAAASLVERGTYSSSSSSSMSKHRGPRAEYRERQCLRGHYPNAERAPVEADRLAISWSGGVISSAEEGLQHRLLTDEDIESLTLIKPNTVGE
jgi:hypothetical protein